MRRQGSEKLGEVGSLLGYLTAGGKVLLLRESGTVISLLTHAASAAWRPSHAGACTLHTKSLPGPRSLEGAHHRRCAKNVTRGRITRRDPSVVRGMLGPVAGWDRCPSGSIVVLRLKPPVGFGGQ